MAKYKTISLTSDLLKEVTDTVKTHPLWINEVEFIRDAIREKINKVTECKAEAAQA
jgi:metal-responsive CopG/Arc/MetJ family transcriptional regulator